MVFAAIEARKKSQNTKQLLRLLKLKGWPPISIVIAAFNEEKAIAKTLASILQSDYPSFEVIVVNDGSSDRTEEVVREFQYLSAKIQLVNNFENIGKANSLNVGISKSQFDYIVTLDADTILADSRTLKKLVLPLIDRNISAVSSNIKVINRDRWITKWQSLEYILAINTVKRARNLFNCILILPGAASAYKRKALDAIAGFSNTTLAEDADLTIALLKKGYKIGFQDNAVALTEAPFTVRDLFKQRLRWQTGNIQCIVKHINVIFSQKNFLLAHVFFPDFILTSFLYFAIFPICSFAIIFSSKTSVLNLFNTLLSLIIIDFILTVFSYLLDREDPREWLYFLSQRVFFFLFNTYLAMYLLYSFLTGRAIAWKAIQRSGKS